MKYVTIGDGIRYGFSLIGYLFIVSFLGTIFAWVGIFFVGFGTGLDGSLIFMLLGSVLALIGWLIIIGGLLGAVYVVIVDGVATAIRKMS